MILAALAAWYLISGGVHARVVNVPGGLVVAGQVKRPSRGDLVAVVLLWPALWVAVLVEAFARLRR